jgi:3-deoxy-D-manno-octulosonate 8-phosphate phosphatase (KDO 8-P phosphatase)
MADLESRLRSVRLVCTDVDGVLTDGTLVYADGPHTKDFNVRDGAAIKWLQQAGIPVVFLSGLESPATRRRADDLGIEDCIMGRLEKLPALLDVCARHGLGLDQVAHIGDDLYDLPLLDRVGLACCPADAVAEVQSACHLRLSAPGGRGAFREAAERILKAQNHWVALLARFQDGR